MRPVCNVFVIVAEWRNRHAQDARLSKTGRDPTSQTAAVGVRFGLCRDGLVELAKELPTRKTSARSGVVGDWGAFGFCWQTRVKADGRRVGPTLDAKLLNAYSMGSDINLPQQGLFVMLVLEVGDDGVLHVPSELLAGARPHAQFELDVLGEMMLLRPAGTTRPFWQQATPGERAEAFEQWAVTSPADTPDLPADCLRREGLYD